MKSRITASGGRKPSTNNQHFKRQKVRDARTIRTETVLATSANKPNNSSDLTESGSMLKVDQFIKTREFEIKQLQLAMHRSKNSNSTRVFQALPRKLRRRTASHNVRRIPKRMRNRALREMMKSDQQQVKAERKASNAKRLHGLTGTQLYKLKMSVKLLRLASRSTSMKLALPKEATASRFNLRMRIRAIKKLIAYSKSEKTNTVNNQMGSYDSTTINSLNSKPTGRVKYIKRQREFVWLPTHVWNAKRAHMIKRWGYQIPWSASQKCFKLTHRLGSGTAASDGAVCIDSSFMSTLIVKDNKSDGKLLFDLVARMTNGRAILPKYHESKNYFQGLLYNINDSKEILGHIDILWISYEQILIRSHPVLFKKIYDSLFQYADKLELQDCRYSIASVTLKGAKSLTALSSILRSTKECQSFKQFMAVSKISDESVLPSKTMFAFEAIDPRHSGAPKKIQTKEKTVNVDDIINLVDKFPTLEFDEIITRLCDPKSRNDSYKNQQTLKQISRRRQQLLAVGKPTSMVPFNSKKDPSIPLVIVRRPQLNDWVIMLPWFWMLPLWCQLTRVPRVYNIGVRQIHQLRFENKRLYFPDDYPFTYVGMTENALYKKLSAKAKWERKTAGKRLNFDKIKDVHINNLPSFSGEVGDPFSCDWKLLQILRNGLEYLGQDDKHIELFDPKKTTQFDENRNRIVEYLNDLFELYKDVTAEEFNPESRLPIILKTGKKVEHTKPIVEQNDIVNEPLPVQAVTLSFIRKGHPQDNARIYSIPKAHLKYWKEKVNGKYRATGRHDNDIKAPLPCVSNLIGFLTSAGFHLGEGHGVGNGFIDSKFAATDKHHLVLVRNTGSNTYRIARWQIINP